MTDFRKQHGTAWKEAMSLIESMIVSFFVILMAFTYLISVSTIRGTSMEDTLHDGDRLLVSCLSAPRCGDIVIVNADSAVTLGDDGTLKTGAGLHKVIVKRVIAEGGQIIDIDFDRGAVWVDGVMLDEEYLTNGLTHMDEGAFTGQYPVMVPEGYVFVMGDNRGVSKDSRSAEIGFVHVEDVRGRAVMRIYPLSGFGFI